MRSLSRGVLKYFSNFQLNRRVYAHFSASGFSSTWTAAENRASDQLCSCRVRAKIRQAYFAYFPLAENSREIAATVSRTPAACQFDLVDGGSALRSSASRNEFRLEASASESAGYKTHPVGKSVTSVSLKGPFTSLSIEIGTHARLISAASFVRSFLQSSAAARSQKSPG